jgi:hypothetical protein
MASHLAWKQSATKMFGDHYEHVSHKFAKNLLSPQKSEKHKTWHPNVCGELTMFHVNIRFTLDYAQCPKNLGPNCQGSQWQMELVVEPRTMVYLIVIELLGV